jgi:hypothetical protein
LQKKIGIDWNSSSLSGRTTRPKRWFKISHDISFRTHHLTWCARRSLESLAWSVLCTCRTCKSLPVAQGTDPEILL